MLACVTGWLDKEMALHAPDEGRPGRPPVFSNTAIQFCLSTARQGIAKQCPERGSKCCSSCRADRPPGWSPVCCDSRNWPVPFRTARRENYRITASGEKGHSGQQVLCATCITAPCARDISRADFSASSGADMYPASRCGVTHAAGPYGVRGSGPDQSRVLEGTLLHTGSPDPVSRRLRQTAPSAPTSSRPTAGLRRRGRSFVDATSGH
ncbi:hypothetical protein PSAL_032370 [Pseudooceanicola algae]|uniref:Uncharacterized protein n=1 Tax=Pseudooceanicola algae TaxID=1537215 RepID=A0A7T1FQJ0_9RHOB|nr:hypothetical protein PSAL_032370 [Pseudooceanicola algae]